jgi:hypothetical protein
VTVTATPAAAADDGRTPDAVRRTTWSAPCEIGCRSILPRVRARPHPRCEGVISRAAVWHPSRIIREPGGAVIIHIGRFRAGTDHAVLPDADAGTHDHAAAQPDVVANHDEPGRLSLA